MAISGNSSLGTGAKAEPYLRRYESLKSVRNPWESFWREASKLILPTEYLDPNTHTVGGPNMEIYEDLYDSTGAATNLILANGQFSHITPNTEQWFNLDPPFPQANTDRAKQWLAEKSEFLFKNMLSSTFSSAAYSVYLQRGAFGGGLFYVGEGRKKPVHYRAEAVGTYCLAEDDERYVDTVFREFVMTTRNMVATFGEENVSGDVLKEWNGENGDGLDKEWNVLQVVQPRLKRDKNKLDAANKPWESIHIEVKTKHVLSESGYDECPFIASRFQMHPTSPYGVGPSNYAIPDIRQLNALELSLDAAQQKLAFPPILAPQEMKGRIDQRSGAITWVPPNLMNPTNSPREFAMAGNPQFGVDRSERKQKKIEDLYYNDIFRLFSQMDVKGVTARAIAEQANEKLGRFQPVFSLMSVETLEPLINRVFAINLRAGNLGSMEDIPPELLQEGTDGYYFPDLSIRFSSRMALAIRARQNAALMGVVEAWAPLLPQMPQILDNLKVDETFRDFARNEGVSTNWLEDLDTMNEARAQRQAEMERQKQMEEAALAADAAGKLKGADPQNLKDLAGLAT